MELILKETISALGREGDIVTVKPGYGRNYLLPKGKAVLANAQNMAILEKNRAVIEARIAEEKKASEALAKKLAGITIETSQLVGEDERLFGSVTNTDIAGKLAEHDITIDKRNILLSEPIKTLGEHTVPIKVDVDTTTDIMVKVTAKTAKE
jgi:large subunit ribosomal protein L9